MGVLDSVTWMKTEFCLLALLQPSIQSIQIGLGVIIAADGVAVIQSMFTANDIKANTKVMMSSIDLVVTVILSFGTCAPILMLNTKARHIPFATLMCAVGGYVSVQIMICHGRTFLFTSLYQLVLFILTICEAFSELSKCAAGTV